MRVPLTQGSYSARSIIASAQRCVNLYAEQGQGGTILELQSASNASPFGTGASAEVGAPRTYYPCPGTLWLAAPPTPAPGRGLYWANSDQLFYAAGGTLYAVSGPPNWTLNAIGSIPTGSTPVSMADNGTTLVLVDGTSNGYQVDLTTLEFTQISPTNNAPSVSGAVYAFYGADRVDILDGYLLFNQPGTRNFYSTYNNEVQFDSLYFAAKNGYSDNLVTVIVSLREIWLLGERTTEIWFDAGDANFPFEIIPGPFIQHGCSAKYSVAQIDGAVYWLSQDQAGQNILLKGKAASAERISNHAIETEWSTYPTVSDAVGFCFQQNGHPFYQINFPTADKSWRYDEATQEWHEPVFTDSNGEEHRHLGQVAAYAYGMNIVADWQTGALYQLDPYTYTDNGQPMQFRRGWPHLMNDGKRVGYTSFTADVECGGLATVGTGAGIGAFEIGVSAIGGVLGATMSSGPSPGIGSFIIGVSAIGGPGNPALVSLRWSDDRGRTFSNPVRQTLGSTGQYLTQPKWSRLGMARDRVFELFGTVPGPFALNGAFIEVQGFQT